MADKKLLALLKQGVETWNEWVIEHPFRTHNLRKADLQGASLSDIDLGMADLEEAILWQATLLKADLMGANLRGANLSHANLQNARLSGANLVSADLIRANLSGADLSEADLAGASLISANLIGANLSGAYLVGVNLRGSQLSGANLQGAHMNSTILGNLDLFLQLELRSIGSQPPLVMTGLRHRLMMTPKERPGQRVSGCDHLVPEQLPDHAQDLWQGVGNHPPTNPLRDLKSCKLLWLGCGSQAFFSCSAFACSTISVAHTWANSESVMCRYQPVQLLTSY